MAQQPIRFDDGDAYERGMGPWSQLVGRVFLDWLAPPSGLRWIDVGCGNGAFTDLLVQQCAPAETQGIDPSEAQLAFARSRPATRGTTFLQGNAMALPFEDARFDAAVMALVIFFVPNPAKGISEMTRVVRSGGVVAAYIWDILDDESPTAPIQVELRAQGITMALPPRVDASRMTALRDLWTGAGLVAVETRVIAVQRTFVDFEDFWYSTVGIPSVGQTIATMTASDVEKLTARLRERLLPDTSGRITYQARANAIKGRVPEPR